MDALCNASGPARQAYLAYLCLWCFDETTEKDREMRGYLLSAANAGHADAIYWLSSCTASDDAEREELLKKAAGWGVAGRSAVWEQGMLPPGRAGQRIRPWRRAGTGSRQSGIVTTLNTTWDSCTSWGKA
jgi:hypothetical protein